MRRKIADTCKTVRIFHPKASYTSNNNVEATFDFVAKNGNNVKRVHRKISSFRQSQSKLNMFNLFRLCRKDEISFDLVSETGNIVAETVNIVVQNGNNVEATFDFVASTLLLVWTGLYASGVHS